MPSISRFGAIVAVFMFGGFVSGCAGDDHASLSDLMYWAQKGDIESQFYLGVCYENGEGVPQDSVQAYMWLALAADRGDKIVIYHRDVVARKLSDETLGMALERTNNLRRQIPAQQRYAAQ